MAAAGRTTPPWPSLYNPGLEILHVEHNSPVQPGGAYLYHAKDIFRFTLYWTIIFYTPLFIFCGSYAFWNYAFPPASRSSGSGGGNDRQLYQLASLNSPHAPFIQPTKLAKTNERRSRVAFALIVLFTFLILGIAGALIGSAIMGFVAAGLFKAANFNMSTWIPFLLAVMQVIVGLLSIWPSIVEII